LKKNKTKKIKRDRLEIVGTIVEACPAGMFRIKLVNDDIKDNMIVIGVLSGKMRKNFIKVVPGDNVLIEVSEYDTSKGRIVKRLNKNGK
jgi:translation initiation factor IF-1